MCGLVFACAITLCMLTACGNASSGEVVTKTTAASGEVLATDAGLQSWTSAMPTGTRVTRLDYSSTSGVDDSRTSVSGSVFVPSGSWPQGGWPLIAYAHGTTGLARDCGPSDHPDMFGDIATIGSFVRAGYAVVTTDYQGLGIRVDAPPHPYLEPRTAAHNVIDAVRAARAVEPTIGPKWVVVGPSQGGAAAWATAELYPRFRDADSGDLVGAVAMSPVLDVSRYPTAAQDGTLNSAQRFLYPLIVVGASHVDPQINPADHLGGMSASEISSLVSCATGRTALAAQTHSRDASTLRSTPGANAELDAAVSKFVLPQQHTDVPILAMYGTADEITPVDVMETSLSRACTLGDLVVRDRREGQGHSFDPGPILGSWISSRLQGLPFHADC